MTSNWNLISRIALTAALVAGTFAPTAFAATDFKDVSDKNIHREAIMDLAERGIIKGYDDGTFRPANDVTRGQAAKMIAMARGFDLTDVVDPGFKDLDEDNGYFAPIAALAERGIITGFPEDNTFRPNDKLTRAQMSKILTLAFEIPGATETELPFTDLSEKNWYFPFVKSLFKFDVTTGTTKTTYSPGDYVHRAAMASFVVRSESIATGEKVDGSIEEVVDTVIEDSVDLPFKAEFDSSSNHTTIAIYSDEAQVADVMNTGVLNAIPYGDIEEAYVSGSTQNLATLSPTEARDAVLAALGVTESSNLNELVGDTVTFTLTSTSGEELEYTFSFTAGE